MSDTCPGEWAEGRAPQLAVEEGGALLGKEEMIRGDGRWPKARPLCYVCAANLERGTIATTASHIWDFPL